MKYFTQEWATGDLSDEEEAAVYRAYPKHLARLRPQLPPDVRRLADEINLHDGLLWHLMPDIEQGTLLLTLRCGDLQVGYFDLELCYLQVLFSPALKESLVGLIAIPLSAASRCSEALYDEVDREEDLLVHRILFVSGFGNYHEFTVHFKQLHLKTTPRKDRYSAGDMDLS